MASLLRQNLGESNYVQYWHPDEPETPEEETPRATATRICWLERKVIPLGNCTRVFVISLSATDIEG